MAFVTVIWLIFCSQWHWFVGLKRLLLIAIKWGPNDYQTGCLIEMEKNAKNHCFRKYQAILISYSNNVIASNIREHEGKKSMSETQKVSTFAINCFSRFQFMFPEVTFHNDLTVFLHQQWRSTGHGHFYSSRSSLCSHVCPGIVLLQDVLYVPGEYHREHSSFSPHLMMDAFLKGGDLIFTFLLFHHHLGIILFLSLTYSSDTLECLSSASSSSRSS